MSRCHKCGLQMGLHHSVLPGCICGTAAPFTYPIQSQPRQWVGLTDEEIDEARDTATVEFRKNQYRVRGQMILPGDSLEWCLARAIEAKLKEKNHG